MRGMEKRMVFMMMMITVRVVHAFRIEIDTFCDSCPRADERGSAV